MGRVASKGYTPTSHPHPTLIPPTHHPHPHPLPPSPPPLPLPPPPPSPTPTRPPAYTYTLLPFLPLFLSFPLFSHKHICLSVLLTSSIIYPYPLQPLINDMMICIPTSSTPTPYNRYAPPPLSTTMHPTPFNHYAPPPLRPSGAGTTAICCEPHRRKSGEKALRDASEKRRLCGSREQTQRCLSPSLSLSLSSSSLSLPPLPLSPPLSIPPPPSPLLSLPPPLSLPPLSSLLPRLLFPLYIQYLTFCN